MIGVSTDILLYNVYFFQCAGVETYLPPVLKGEDTEKCRMFADSAHYLTNVPYPTQMSSSVPLVRPFVISQMALLTTSICQSAYRLPYAFTRTLCEILRYIDFFMTLWKV